VTSDQGNHTIHWRCGTQTNTLGFEVLRSLRRTGPFEVLNSTLIPVQESGEYKYLDRSEYTGENSFYKLVAKDRDGSQQTFGPVEVTAVLPQRSRLVQNYPNPFNPETTIQYELTLTQEIDLVIYNMSGQSVRTLFSGMSQAGYHRVIWDGRSDNGHLLPSGVYYCQLTGTNVRQSIKLVFFK
jgi:hypothetical protein